LPRLTLIRASSFRAPRRSGCGTEPALIPTRTFDQLLLEVNQLLTFDNRDDIEASPADTKSNALPLDELLKGWQAGDHKDVWADRAGIRLATVS
jgi:hypothetical protein